MQGPETENNNDYENEAMAPQSGRAWQYICIRKGSFHHAKCHGLDVPTGWNTMGPAASGRCEDTFLAKPNVKEIFVTFQPGYAYKWKLQEIWLEGMVWCRPTNEDLLMVTKPIRDSIVLSLQVTEVANNTDLLLVEASKLSGDILFSRELKKDYTWARVKEKVLQELQKKHNYTDLDTEGVTMCAHGILLAKDFLRCVISKKEFVFATYKANGALRKGRH